MELTLQQKLAITTGVVGAATAAFGALNSVMTPTEALIGTVILGFISACLGTVGTVLSSQGAQIKAVAAMPGIERMTVNASANETLAQAAVSSDPALAKIEPTTAANSAVNATAKGN